MRFVIVPGIHGSDEDHWQTAWEHDLGPAAVRIQPTSWSEPDPADWISALDRCVRNGPSLLIAHSLGCHAVAHWAARPAWVDPGILGAVLVAPPDPAGAAFPAAAAGFAALPAAPLPFPGLVIASDDDPYATPAATAGLADGWGVPVVSMGRAGHLNSASRLGDWPAGRALVTAFRAGLRDRPRPPAPRP